MIEYRYHKKRGWLTKLIRAIRIFPVVFQLIVDDTRKMREHKASIDSIPIGMNVSQK